MKLKKILSGFLAAAMAVTTMVTASVTAGAAAIDKPDGNEVVVATFSLSQWDEATSTTINADEFTVAQWGGCWASLYSLPDDTFTNENYYVKVTFTTDEVLKYADDGVPLTTVLSWGWSNYSAWPLNAGKFYDGTVTADGGQGLIPATNSTDTVYYCYLPVSDFDNTKNNISGNVQSALAGDATIKSVQLVEISSLPAPELPKNEYAFDKASGTANNWGQPAEVEVGSGKTITSAVLEGDFVVAAPYVSDTRPKLVLSDGSGDGNPLNWIQISPSVVVDGVAYYVKADVVAAWKTAGGSEELAEVVKILIACGDANDLTVTGVKLYSSVAATTKYKITVAESTNGTVESDKDEAEAGETVTLDVKPDEGYELDTLTVATSTAGTDTVTVAADNTFIMPDANVTVTAAFKEKVVPLESISLDKTAKVLVGGTKKLSAEKLPEGTTDKNAITWTSSDETVATVASDGTVTGVKAGTATITAACGTIKATCEVTITADAIACTSVTLDKTEATVMKGAAVTLKATALPEGTTDTITWTTSDASIATVKDGVVTGVARGVATITVKCGEQTASCKVSVNEEETVAVPASPSMPAKTFKSAVTDGKYNDNEVFVLSADDVKTAKSVTVTVTDSTGKKTTRDVTECYKKVTYTAANGTTDTITAGANYLLAVTVTGIPDGTTVTVSIAVKK